MSAVDTDDSRPDCCRTWDNNPRIALMTLMHARRDAFPVTEGHALIIPHRHVESLFDLEFDEVEQLFALLDVVRDQTPADGYTVAVNDGEAAGRTVPHLHVHVIPRRWGDVPDPRGGIRRLLVDPASDPWLTRR